MPGSVIGNFSPLPDDTTELKNGDLVKMCELFVLHCFLMFCMCLIPGFVLMYISLDNQGNLNSLSCLGDGQRDFDMLLSSLRALLVLHVTTAAHLMLMHEHPRKYNIIVSVRKF